MKTNIYPLIFYEYLHSELCLPIGDSHMDPIAKAPHGGAPTGTNQID